MITEKVSLFNARCHDAPGIPPVVGCPHHWHIYQNKAGRQIGVCQVCRERRDFTEVQENDKGWKLIFFTKPRPVYGASKTIEMIAHKRTW